MTEQSLKAQEFAALIREALLEMATKGWQANQLGIGETQMLTLMAPAMEPLVQSITRAAVRR